MKDEEVKTKYRISEKCEFDFSQFPKLEDVSFLGVRYPKKGHLVLSENGIVTFSSSASKPIIHLLEGELTMDKTGINQFTFNHSWVKDQFPHSWYTKFSIEQLARTGFYDERYYKGNYGSFAFNGPLKKIVSMNKYHIQFKGKSEYIDYEFYDGSDDVYEFDIDMHIDVAYGLDLDNGKSIIFTYSERGESYFVYIGDKSDLKDMAVLRLPWLNKQDEYIDMVETKIL